jgi:two-component system chemotaxis sensor kinase CheA
MRFGLGGRIFGGFLLVGAAGVGVSGWLVDRNVERTAYEQTSDRLRYEVTMAGQMTASALFAPVAKGDQTLQAPIRDLAHAVDTHLSLVAPDGWLVADSEVEAPGEELVAEAEEVRRAVESGRGTSIRAAGGERRLWVAEAVRRDGNLLGVVRASIPTRTVEAQVRAVRQRLLLGAVSALAVAVLIAAILTFGIVRPARALARAARRIGEGELDVRTRTTAKDELGDLGRALDEMADSLQASMKRLDARNSEMRLVLDNVAQGLVTVDAKGVPCAERSARLAEWFGDATPGARLWEMVPGLAASTRRTFELAWDQLEEGFLPADAALDQLPKRVASGDRVHSFEFLPVAGKDDASPQYLVVVTDVTLVVEAEHREAVQRDALRILDRMARDREGVIEFVRDAESLVNEVTGPEMDATDLKRQLHTLKGNCSVYGLHSIATLCHDVESRFVEGSGVLSAESREVLVSGWAEMRKTLEPIVAVDRHVVMVPKRDYLGVLRAMVAGESPKRLAPTVAGWTATPAEGHLVRLADHAKSIAERLGKSVTVNVDGGGVRVDPARWSAFWAAFVHAVRNAVDHGIELPAQRAAAGKAEDGILSLSVAVRGLDVVVAVEDDGRGIPWDVIAGKLRERGLPADSHADLVEGVFLDGLSSASEVTEVSGRGVGMGALRAAIAELGGRVDVSSAPNRGTRIACTFSLDTVSLDPAVVLERELARRSLFPSLAPSQLAVHMASLLPASLSVSLSAPSLPTLSLLPSRIVDPAA